MKRYFILAAAVVFQLCLGGIYAWSYFVPRLEETFGIPAGQAQQIFGVCIFVFTLSMIAGGRLQRRHGPRRVALASALCYACGYLGAGFWAVEFWHFLAFKGVLEGLGIGLGYVCPLTTALKWFPNRKGMVTGLVVGGFGGGAIVLSSAAHYLFGYGWELSQVFVLLGAGYLIVAGLSAAMLSWPGGKEGVEGGVYAEVHACSPGLFHLLRDNRLWTLALAMFAGTFGGLLIIGSLNPIGLEGGIAGAHAVLAISVFSVGNSIGRLVWGVLIDRFGKVTIPASLFLLALAVAALLPGRAIAPSTFILASGLVGFAFGACFVLYATQTSIVFGPEMVGLVYPLIFLIGYGLPGIFGPGVGGALYELVGNYSVSIIAAAGLAAVGGVVAIVRLYGGIGIEKKKGENMNKQKHQPVTLSQVHKTLLDHVPFWQGMGFILMICLVWAVYLFELPKFFFSKEVTEDGWFGLSLITAVIIVMGFVIVAHSYVQQRRVLKGFISVCSYCKKVRVKQGVDWMQIEHYVSERSLANFSHSVCPDCFNQVMQEFEQEQTEELQETEEVRPARETVSAEKGGRKDL